VALVLWVSDRSGVVQQETPAISIELALSNTAEQLPAEEISDIVHDQAKAVEVSDAPDIVELKATEPKELASSDAAAQGVDVIEGSAALDDALGKDAHKPQTYQPRTEPKHTNEPPRREPVEKRQPTPRKNVAAETSSVGAKSKAPRASASTGSVVNYASRVRAKVSGHVPRSGAGKGSVVVSFGVTTTGGLSYARIAKSSGNAATDRAVLAGVRSAAPFPAPPAGASPSQLRFSVSFNFR
jgi:protein TonB